MSGHRVDPFVDRGVELGDDALLPLVVTVAQH